MKSNMWRRMLAGVLTSALVLSNVPVTALASDVSTVQEAEDAEADQDVVQNEEQDVDSVKEDAETTQSEVADNAVKDNEVATQAAATDDVPDYGTIEVENGSISNSSLKSKIEKLMNASQQYANNSIALTAGENRTQLSSLSVFPASWKAGTYDIEAAQKNYGSTWRPSWGDWKKVGTCKIRTYYNVKFSISGDDGAGSAVIDGTAKKNDETAKYYYGDTDQSTFTVTPVDGYAVKSVTISGKTLQADANGVYTIADTYKSEQTIQIVYESEKGVEVSGESSSNATITIDGKQETQKVAFGSTHKVEVTPASGYVVNAIYIEKQDNKEALDMKEVTFNKRTASQYSATFDLTVPAESEGISMIKITADVVKAQLVVSDNNDVPYHDGMAIEETDQLRQRIFETAVDTEASVPTGLTWDQVTIEYDASSLGIGAWKVLDYTPSAFEFSYHAFGKGFGDKDVTEKIRITYDGAGRYPQLRARTEVNLTDDRKTTSMTIKDGITLKYNTQEAMDEVMRTIMLQYVVITDEDGKAISTKESDFVFEYNREVGEQTLTVKYKGNKTYKPCSSSAQITITKGDASVKVKSQNIRVGDTLDKVFSCTPEEAKLVGLIAGINGDGGLYVSLDAASVTINDIAGQNVPVVGELSLQEALNQMGIDEIRLGDLADTMEQLNSFINKFLPGTDISSFVNGIQQVVDIITKVAPGAEDTVVSLGGVPSNAGVYLAAGVTVNPNYNTAVGMGMITIAPKRTDVKITFKNDMASNKISVKEAELFDFGGQLKDSEELVDGQDHLRTFYTGLTVDGKVWASSEPCREAGRYEESIYVVGGDYFASPIMRSYTIAREKATIRFEAGNMENGEVTVPYDGQPHAIAAGVYDESGVRISDVTKITYMAGSSYYSEDAPINVGAYQVMATYDGDSTYEAVDAVYARLVIEEKKVTITPNPINITYGDAVPEFTYTVTDEQGNTLEAEEIASLGDISVTRVEKVAGLLDQGTYTLQAQIDNANANYDITCGENTLTVEPRPVVLKIDNTQMQYGDAIPEFTKAFYEGDVVSEVVDMERDFPDLKVSVDGATEGRLKAGTYTFVVEGYKNPNYMVELEVGGLEVSKKPVRVSVDAKKKLVGEDDPELTYAVLDAETEDNGLVDGDELGLILTREDGENPGLYDIYVNADGLNPNYTLISEADGTDKFEIQEKKTEPENPNPGNPEKPNSGNSGSKDNQPSNGKANDNSKNVKSSVQTGDTANVGLNIVEMLIAFAMIVAVLIYRRKRVR